jgi:hypothetical protein
LISIDLENDVPHPKGEKIGSLDSWTWNFSGLMPYARVTGTYKLKE